MAKGTTPAAIRGTQDIFGDAERRFARVVDIFAQVRRLYSFDGVIMPVIELSAVFSRSLGEATDVVAKEMYSFEDRGGEQLTLRPEFTAGIARAYLTNGWQQHAPLKLATHGPLFRYERPQKGRYRQFHQINAEIIGAAEPQADVEMLAMADQLLRELGVQDGVTLQLNTLGDSESRNAWRAALVDHFSSHRAALSPESQDRLARNPLRILDSKEAQDRPIADAAPDIDDFLTPAAQDFFAAVTSGLEASGVGWTRNSRLVRGLDYYRHTAFEFVTDRLGAQGTVLGGGRYDGLIETLGGPPTPAVGWAAGIERLAMLVVAPAEAALDVAVVVEDDALINVGLWLATALRQGYGTDGRWNQPASVVVVSSGSSKKRFERAKAMSPQRFVILNNQSVSAGSIGNLRCRGDWAEWPGNLTLWDALCRDFQRVNPDQLKRNADIELVPRL